MKILENILTATDFIRLYESAGLGKKSEERPSKYIGAGMMKRI